MKTLYIQDKRYYQNRLAFAERRVPYFVVLREFVTRLPVIKANMVAEERNPGVAWRGRFNHKSIPPVVARDLRSESITN